MGTKYISAVPATRQMAEEFGTCLYGYCKWYFCFTKCENQL